jgi:hypothetical protein
MEEVWKFVFYNNRYSVSNYGGIRNNKRNKLIKPEKLRNGYLRVVLSSCDGRQRYLVHRLVLSSFVREPNNNEECDHIDGIRDNNALSNLRWLSPKDNVISAANKGHMSRRGEKHGLHKLCTQDVLDIREYLHNHNNITIAYLAEKYNVSITTIRDVYSRKTWNHI